jgi:hypothetical protein
MIGLGLFLLFLGLILVVVAALVPRIGPLGSVGWALFGVGVLLLLLGVLLGAVDGKDIDLKTSLALVRLR